MIEISEALALISRSDQLGVRLVKCDFVHSGKLGVDFCVGECPNVDVSKSEGVYGAIELCVDRWGWITNQDRIVDTRRKVTRRVAEQTRITRRR